MSRILLISSNRCTDPYPVYPLGMAVVAGAMQQAGHQVRQYDCLAQGIDGLLPALADFAPQLVAISIRNIDDVNSFSGEQAWYLKLVKELIDGIRASYAGPIVVGGAGLTLMPEAIVEFLQVDHAVVAEGERALPQLVATLAAGEPAPQIIRSEQLLDGDAFATPLFDPELVPFYRGESGHLNLQTKRGCAFRCSYCSYPLIEGGRFRTREPRLVVEELARLVREHDVDQLFFTDSIFNDPQGHYLEVAEELLRQELKLQWSAYFRPQGFGRRELALLKRAGLYALELGPDAACDRTLAGINKGLSFAEVLEVNHACLAERLPAAHFVIFGGPEEDESTLAEGLDNLELLEQSVVFAFSGIRIHPNTALQQRAIADGVISAGQSLLKPSYYFSPRLDHQWMEAQIEARFAGRSNRIFPPSEGLKRMEVMKQFGYRGLMWDKLVRFPRKNR
jgi:lipid biosynthesis B12-binding/radical SAM protein